MKRLHATLLLFALQVAPALAAESCASASACVVPAQPGKTTMNSQVQTRKDGGTPPSVEYRRPDEVFTLKSPDADEAPAVTRTLPAFENRPEPLPTVLPQFSSGLDILGQPERQALVPLLQRLQGKQNIRLRITGHADQQRMTPDTIRRFGDNKGLSEARAKVVADFLRTQPGMENARIESQGRGDSEPLVSCDPGRAYAGHVADMIAFKSCLAPNRRVEIEVWYDQPVEAQTEVARDRLPIAPVAGTGLCHQQRGGDAGLPFRVSVDGEPLETQDVPNTADVTRCIDVGLEKADIQVRFDGFEVTPFLNITAYPDGVARGASARFTPYSNYAAFIRKAEVRIFAATESTLKSPLAVLALDPNTDTAVEWNVAADSKLDAVQYILRVYDEHGRFDETTPKLLRLLDKPRPPADTQTREREALIGYGENHRGLKNIPVQGGAVTVNGERLVPGSRVQVFGRAVPVDANGKFAVRQILPAGNHVVSVTVSGPLQARAEFSRHLYIPVDDWFYVALADLTAGQNNVKGPAQIVTGDDSKRYREEVYVDGRLAFYLKGKIKGEYLLTASADTREQPFEDLFTNFNSKDPRYLLRRIDPNAYYPVYGDDSTLIEDAPTQGKFYVKLQKGDSHVLWGSFQTRLTGTDLVNYSRALYGAQGRYQSPATTQFGEKRTQAEVFAADPGTLASVEEFRGTGGSLYYLRHQDILVGSERLRKEVRDRDSGMLLSSTTLIPNQDYEINALQGRIVLREPLPAYADAATLVMTGPLTGHPVYLVAGYEYTPGVTAADNLTTGGRASYWANDFLNLGITGYKQDGTGTEQKILGGDVTLRYKPGTYLKLESANSEGPGNGALSSQNGGFNFGSVPQTTTAGINASAHRAEAVVDLKEVGISALPGSFSTYWLKREDGYSAPGQLTNEALDQAGLQAKLQATQKLELQARVDSKDGSASGLYQAAELGASYAITENVSSSIGVRRDDRATAAAAGSSAILAETGARTDLAAKLAYHPVAENGAPGPWEIYGLAQGTLERDSTRSENDRYGAGSRYQINDRVTVSGEITDGDGGVGAKLGADYRLSDRSSVYLNYLLDNGRSDSGYRGRTGNLTGGVKSRYTDSLSVYAEERYQTADAGPSGLIHAFGLDLAANDRWSYGLRLEKGITSDPVSGDLDRNAVSVSTGYQYQKVKYGGVIEHRTEAGNTSGKRDSWLMKNTLGYQTTPDWRLLSRFNVARSEAGALSSSDANYTEAVLGFGYRPVLNDRLNALFKYSYLSDLSSPGQVGASGAANPYEQRSHVLAVDGIYDLTPKFSIGGKLGYRFGQLRDSSVSGSDWFDSRAWLAIVRGDWHVVHAWDVLAELRYLNAEEAQDAKSGALLGVYRHIDSHIKAGVGYNFTDFSDNLTDLSYRSHGWFINVLGKY